MNNRSPSHTPRYTLTIEMRCQPPHLCSQNSLVDFLFLFNQFNCII